jgi:hypothetical protein
VDMDIDDYVQSDEWDLLNATGFRNRLQYACCPTPVCAIAHNNHRYL